MIDLHTHLLPSFDDGAVDLAMALDMARQCVAQGVSIVACTPHILPGLYANTGPNIRTAVAQLQAELDHAGIQLQLVTGADNHVVPSFLDGLRQGHLLTLADTGYVLVEPPHHVIPPRMDRLFLDLLAAGYTPILTHPERLTWIEHRYALVRKLVDQGVWIQITSGSLKGRFGRRARAWSERFLKDGCTHILASDAHNLTGHPPDLADGFAIARDWVGTEEAEKLVVTRPLQILYDVRSVCAVKDSFAKVGEPNERWSSMGR